MNADQQPTNKSSTHDEQTILKRRAELHDFLRECGSCQSEVEPNWQFCANCGTRLATACPGCGAPLPPAGAHACPSCGLEIPQINIILE